VRLVGGRSLSQSQVEAIVNLVAASVPGMSADAVRVVDQNGRLLSSPREEALDSLLLQRELEGKLADQIDALLLPLLGEGNYSAQVQASLDQNEVTTARETYEKEGVVRNESERNATRTGAGPAGGVPGATTNTPPPQATLVDGPPQPAPPATATSTDTETASQRNYDLGREVAVTSTRPGALTKLSVAVAVSDAALKKAAPMTAAQLEALVSAAVGADAARGDLVEVVASKFEPADLEPPAFYEEPWFAMLVRYGTALIAVLLVLLFAVRPLIGKLRGRGEPAAAPATDAEGENVTLLPGTSGGVPIGDLPRQVELARQLAVSQPDRAVEALQRMLAAPDDTPATTGAEPSAT
jgi:flagellar M-ring protein FliF